MAKSSASVQRRRDNLRALGLRPVQIWVPDTRASGFAEEYRRQSALLALPKNRDSDIDAWLEENNRALWADLDRLEA
jgi:hypothetical protein